MKRGNQTAAGAAGRPSALAGLLVSGLSCATASAQTPSFQGVGFLPGGGNTIVTGLSADGTTVVGYGNSTGSAQQAFRWVGGTITGLGFISGGNTSQALGVSGNGQIIVGHATTSTTFNDAVRWDTGAISGIATSNCGGQGPFANAISSNGAVIVGNLEGTIPPTCFPQRPYQLSPTISPFLGNASGMATGVNADGSVIVGRYSVFAGGNCNPCTQTFRWSAGSTTTIGDFGGNFSAAYGVSADGSVVVGAAAVNNVAYQPFR